MGKRYINMMRKMKGRKREREIMSDYINSETE